MSQTVLAFESFTIDSRARARGDYDVDLLGADLALGPGDLLLARLEPGRVRHPLADAAEGLIEPVDGRATFCGEDWRVMSAERQATRRGRIGRVFDGPSFVSNLDVDQNVLLKERHHTRRPDAEIAEAAESLARSFGLPGLSRRRTHLLDERELRLSSFVRAFLGEPDLIVLERPTEPSSDDEDEDLPVLVEAVGRARRRGAAVIWTTTSDSVWTCRDLGPTLCRVMSGPRMHDRGEPT